MNETNKSSSADGNQQQKEIGSLGRIFQSFGAVTKKALSWITTNLMTEVGEASKAGSQKTIAFKLVNKETGHPSGMLVSIYVGLSG